MDKISCSHRVVNLSYHNTELQTYTEVRYFYMFIPGFMLMGNPGINMENSTSVYMVLKQVLEFSMSDPNPH